ncbi:MAG: hypothetical protein JNL74_22050, partial [Fibrobacteres bacterium]|nr:hypothetical protein [Fibrobacterota bacterium]
MDIDLRQIVPRCGGQQEAFEELCCQLAHHTSANDAHYVRLYGAGGDGGIECYLDLPDGIRIGWQAKYVFKITSLLDQATRSLTAALKNHPSLKRYVVCFPFDFTGTTNRKGMGSQWKFDSWKEKHEKKAQREGRQLTIEAWPAFRIRELLLEFDGSGGLREFFFNKKILSNKWFAEHLALAKKAAGPRYTPELNVKTDLWKWFAAFGRTTEWSKELKDKILACRKAHDYLASAIKKGASDPCVSAWPQDLHEEAQLIVDDVTDLLSEYDRLVTLENPELYRNSNSQLQSLLSRFAVLETKLVEDLEAQHGRGRADSPGFRQYMAEYMVSFPAANLDYTREVIAGLTSLDDWLRSPSCFLAYEPAFVLTGNAGSGKTHGVCDGAFKRFHEEMFTCIVFGHEFRGEPDPWTRLLETLRLPIALGADGLLDAFNAAGEASGSKFLLFIDAINETRPLQYWRERLLSIVQMVRTRPYVRLCVTCRTSFSRHCIPDGHNLPIVEHAGFAGIQRDACHAFFSYYKLHPPIAPILQPELSNPLYLRLVCETLRSSGLRRMPSGWHGLAPTIRAFLDEKERQFSLEYETSEGAKIISGCLMAIVHAIAELGEPALPWTQAQRAIINAKPQVNNLPVLEWLIKSDLVVEDVPVTESLFGDESVIRPAFERLGDFLIASEVLKNISRTGFAEACQLGGPFYKLFKDSQTLAENGGILAALSILVPEKKPGLELPNLVSDGPTRTELLQIAIQSLPSREPATFTSATASLINEGLGLKGHFLKTMDSIIAISWQPSAIDAIWFDALLKQRYLANRDSFWCVYLHQRYETHGTICQLIDAAFELPLDQLEQEIAERWTIILLWFTAAADRRVKNKAIRAATAILAAHPQVIVSILKRLIDSDDDEIREQTLLGCYGALIISRNAKATKTATEMLHHAYKREPQSFGNALIRDHIRCITELAQELAVLPKQCDPELTMRPIISEWPLALPQEDQIKAWGKLLGFRPDEFFSDFFKYSMNCLRTWDYGLHKKNMGEWILQRVVRDFRYEGSGCEKYDGYMLSKYGGGRSKPTWAERIGKKYQWIAMYQLASRLHDHVKRAEDSWEPRPLKTPSILSMERKLDPTLTAKIADGKRYSTAWWMNASADLDPAKALTDAEWVARESDVPPLEKLLSVIKHGGQNWRPIVSYLTWGRSDPDAGIGVPYRQTWMNIRSFLIKKRNLTAAYRCLHRRNFFGEWMPKGASWIYGFVGEYPWATIFNTEPDEWHGSGGQSANLPAVYMPCWNEVGVEWEYDNTIPRNFHIVVPSRRFFSLSDLWWNGRDGYRLLNGRTVFKDPSVT